MLSDLPYLSPLLFHLRNDEALKDYFTEKSFFMPKTTLVSATEEAMKKDCPAPRALWILPDNTTALNPKSGCVPVGNHTFYVTIFTQCIRNPFELIKKDNKIELGGTFMELTKIRRAVKISINKFENQNRSILTNKFSNITWMGDQNLHPDEEGFIVSALQYNVTIN